MFNSKRKKEKAIEAALRNSDQRTIRRLSKDLEHSRRCYIELHRKLRMNRTTPPVCRAACTHAPAVETYKAVFIGLTGIEVTVFFDAPFEGKKGGIYRNDKTSQVLVKKSVTTVPRMASQYLKSPRAYEKIGHVDWDFWKKYLGA